MIIELRSVSSGCRAPRPFTVSGAPGRLLAHWIRGITSALRRSTAPVLKHHLMVDRHGALLAVTLTDGNHHDVTQLLPLLDAVPPIRGLRGRPRRKPQHLYADRGYTFDKYRRLLWKCGIRPMIARRGLAHASGLGKVRWVVERAFAWLHQSKRLRLR